MLIQELSSYLAYYPIAQELTECAEEQAVLHEQTYRKVTRNQQRTSADFSFQYSHDELLELDNSGKRLVWRRLPYLLDEPFGSLFRSSMHSNFNQGLFEQGRYPSFFAEVGLLPCEYYQSLFTSARFNPTGRYTIIAQVNGSYRAVAIDDMVPVYESTNRPLWGMDSECPWAILLLKVWAQINGGYQTLVNCQPFEFIRTFTFPNWKLRILQIEPRGSLLEDLRLILPSDGQPKQDSSVKADLRVQSVIVEHILPQERPSNADFRQVQSQLVRQQRTAQEEGGVFILQQSQQQQQHQQQQVIQDQNPSEIVVIPISVENPISSGIPISPIPQSKILAPPGVYIPPPPRPLLSQELQRNGRPIAPPVPQPPILLNTQPQQFASAYIPQQFPPRFFPPPIPPTQQMTTSITGPAMAVEPPHFMSFMPFSSQPPTYQPHVPYPPGINPRFVPQLAVSNVVSYPPPTVQPQPRYYQPPQQPLSITPQFASTMPPQPETTEVTIKTVTVQRVETQLVTHTFGEAMRKSEFGVSTTNFTVIAKTKDNAKLQSYGLLPNCAGYRIARTLTISTGEVLLKIETSSNHDWNGKYSVYDSNLNNLNLVKDLNLKLRKSFLISYQDFLNLFSHVIISSIDYSELVGIKHQFLTMAVQPNHQQAMHFYLKVANPCVVDISIVQSGHCLKEEAYGSILQKRFLKAKVMIARERELERRVLSLADILRRSRIDQSIIRNPTSHAHPSRLQSKFGSSNNLRGSGVSIRVRQEQPQTVVNVWQNLEQLAPNIGSNEPESNPSVIRQSRIPLSKSGLPLSENQYEYVVFQQTTGLCQNETFQGSFGRGEYVVRVKMETHSSLYQTILHVVSSQPVQLRPINLTKDEKSLVMRSTIMDYCRRIITKKQYLTPERRNGHCDWVCFRPSYEEIGYGFIAFLSEEISHNKIVCRFNPQNLKQEGFLCKDIYKNRTDNIELESARGSGHVIILKRIQNSITMPRSVQLFLDQS